MGWNAFWSRDLRMPAGRPREGAAGVREWNRAARTGRGEGSPWGNRPAGIEP